MRRNFLLLTTLEDYARSKPIYARSVVAALLLSHSIRRDAAITLSFAESFSIRIMGNSIRGLAPDEASVIGVLDKAVRWGREGKSTPHRGVRIIRGFQVPRARCAFMVINGEGDLEELFRGCSDVLIVIPISSQMRIHVDAEPLPMPNYLPEQRITIINYILDITWHAL